MQKQKEFMGVQGSGYSSVTGCTEEDLIRNFVSN